jgi:tRNA (uracil-5-)-methyltransferase
MNCSSFGKCGSCILYEMDYTSQLEMKKDKLKEMFCEFDMPEIQTFSYKDSHYRARAEFRIWHEGEKSFYGMRDINDGRRVVTINECKIVVDSIYETMPKLMEEIEKNDNLRNRLYGIDFLSNANGELIVTLIYHRKVDETIAPDIKILKDKFTHCDFIVRRKGKKYVFDKDYLIDEIDIDEKTYKYKIIENTFTQPNREMSKKMIKWAKDYTKSLNGDLVELYCGNGNFTIPLSENFNKVIATEISQQSIDAAFFNADINDVNNITFLALSAADFSRLKSEKSPLLAKYKLKNILIDPPRAGLDDKSRKFVDEFENIIYISCNPETLKRDLETLTQGRKVLSFAFFDQFPWTNHMECGVVLQKI